MIRKIWIPVILVLTGVIILLLPDSYGPSVQLNRTHGPSPVDMLGLFLIACGWLASCAHVIKRRGRIIEFFGHQISYALFILYLLSLSGVAFGLAISNDLLLWINAIIAFLINIFFIIASLRKCG